MHACHLASTASNPCEKPYPFIYIIPWIGHISNYISIYLLIAICFPGGCWNIYLSRHPWHALPRNVDYKVPISSSACFLMWLCLLQCFMSQESRRVTGSDHLYSWQSPVVPSLLVIFSTRLRSWSTETWFLEQLLTMHGCGVVYKFFTSLPFNLLVERAPLCVPFSKHYHY